MTLAPCEYGINEHIYFHSYLCCQHIFAISLKLICLLHSFFFFFSCTWAEILASCGVYVHFPYLTYLSFPHFKFYLYHIISDVCCRLILDYIMQVWFHSGSDPVSFLTNSTKWNAERMKTLYRNMYEQTFLPCFHIDYGN